jgi:HSP20 family protein
MSYAITPGSFWRFPSLPAIWEDEEDTSLVQSSPSGLSVSEDDKHVYIEASVPGVDPKDIEVSFHKGVLWVKGETKIEEKEKKYYRRATSSFSYRIAVPGEIDINKEPDASCKNGVMTVKFYKSPTSQPKKITVKNSK